MGSSREDKIQTGLRVPEKQYQRLIITADRMGVSLNALILVLIEIGQKAVGIMIHFPLTGLIRMVITNLRTADG